MRIHRFTIGDVASILIPMTHAKTEAMGAFQLAARRLFDIPDAAAVQIRCTAGSLWITLDHDTRDIILAPGESFSTGEHRRALVYALEPAAFALSAPRQEGHLGQPRPLAA
ncbi:MAG: hypothetical protein JWQ76_2807 [Ramlibacter sp.]|nr:hypothetical protein [Ramlibacter sp.]